MPKNITIPWWRGLGFRLLTSILLMLMLFMLFIGQWAESRIENMLRDDVRNEAMALADSHIAGLKTLMLNGDGQLVSEWLGRMEGTTDIEDIRIYRRDGSEAFTDLSTIHQVNQFLGGDAFSRHPVNAHSEARPDDEHLHRAVRGETVLDDREAGHFTLMMPIKVEKACLRCHGYEDHPVRGVFFVRLSTLSEETRIADLHQKSLIYSAVFALVLLAAVWLLLQGLLFGPMDALLSSIRRLLDGSPEKGTLPLKRQDEFGELARGFKELEQVWALRERRVQLILQHIPDGVVTIDGDGHVLSINPAAQVIFDRPVEELLGRNILDDLYPPARATREDVTSLATTGLKALTETIRECVGKARDGRLFPIELEVCPFDIDYMLFMRERSMYDIDKHGNFLIFLRDLTVRKRAEGEMRLLAAVVNQANDAILITDPSGTIEYVNNAFYRITQFMREEVIGKKPSILKSGEYDARYYERMWVDLLAGKVWKDVFVNRRKDGSTYHAEQTIAPIFDGYGNISHLVSIQRDISRERDLQSQMEHLQRLESLGVLSSGIAHDFNNILAAVMGNAELLGMDMPADSEGLQSIEAIMSATKRGAGLCRELMTYAGKGKRDIDWINLESMLEELKHMLQVTIPQHIEMRFSLDDDLPHVRADIMQLEQVMMNLLINAREAIGSKQGKIEVSGRRVIVEREWFDSAYYDKLPERLEFVELCVRDNGCGMDDEVKGRVFDPFYTTKFTGRGLGMSAVLGIIQSHQGAIRCDSQPGVGTVFTVMLPCAELMPAVSSEEVLKETEQGEDGHHGNGIILLVEDEPAIRDIFQIHLNHAGYGVRAWGEAALALEDFKTHRDEIDLVMVDISMPGMSGPALLEKLRAEGMKVPVVVCSGEPYEDVMVKLGSQEVDAVFSKPFEHKLLLRKLAELLAKDE